MILLQSLAPEVPQRVPPRMHWVEHDQMYVFFVRDWAPPAQSELPQEAVQFFERNQQLFAHVDTIEFRFPTYVLEEEAARGLLREHKEAIRDAFARLRGLAQLTVYLREGAAEGADRSSGTAYLRSKRDAIAMQDSALRRIQQTLGDRLSDAVMQADRLLLLVPKADAAEMMRAVRAAGHELAGPFPPSAFAKLVF